MFISSISPTSAAENQIERHNIEQTLAALSSAIEENDVTAFSESLKNIDINTYFDYEGTQTLLSGLLLNFLVNPDVENGETFIHEVLAGQPNLNLPITNDFSLTYSDVLKAAQQSFVAELADCDSDEAKEINICLSRIEIIMNYLGV